MKEIWKDIDGYNGLYQVSNLGRVKSLDRFSGNKFVRGQFLKGEISNRGYLRVSLHNNKKVKVYTVHRLVAEAFLPNPLCKPCVDHIDTDKSNNTVMNLRWVTHQENMLNEITYKQNIVQHQEKKKVINCFTLKGEFVKQYESTISVKKDGHSAGVVSQCCNGKLKKHHGFIWRYA